MIRRKQRDLIYTFILCQNKNYGVAAVGTRNQPNRLFLLIRSTPHRHKKARHSKMGVWLFGGDGGI